MSSHLAARRYAKALFYEAHQQQALQPIAEQTRELHLLLTQSEDLQTLLTSPLLTASRRTTALQQLFAGKLHPLFLRFILFLDAKKRLGLLQPLIQHFLHMVRREQGIQPVTVTTAIPLTPSHLQAVTEKLARQTGKKIELTTRVNPALLGGLQIQIDDQIQDYSIAAQLELFKQRILQA